tara:strand:- start:1940 stop:8155 length:6216 start_codon:yes stop_codon:yes gene_type:complete
MAKQNRNSKTSTSVITNSFIKGMNKDITQSMEPAQSWWHARNAANNSTDGDLGVIGNEPSNLQCGVIPYTIIGAIHRFGDEWIIYSTDDVNSEIGRFDDSECKYTTIVNDPCLNFNRKYLITGAAKENFDCTWAVYWDDGNNPSRYLNVDDVPWKQYISSASVILPDGTIQGDPCIVYSDIEPKELDCEKIRLAPLLDTPCVSLTKNVDGGMLNNGSYQAFIAYTENEIKVTDYIGISNVQSLWSHQGSGGSLDISVSNLDTDYEFYELTLLIRQQGQVFAKRIGLYSTQQQNINVDFISDELIAVDLKIIPMRSPAYEKSEAMYVVNDYLIRQGPTEQFDFNYQPIANEIKVNWVANQVDSQYYHIGGNKTGFLRDEQYAFFIRWIYNTGERSSSYHIPGRAPELYNVATQQFTNVPGPDVYYENENIINPNALNPTGEPLYKIFNTGDILAQGLSEVQEDGSLVIGRGKMGYWESTERYPINKPDIWGDLCGLPIRHHKMPTEERGGSNSPLHISTTAGDLINLLGVEFTNIGRPKNNDGSYIQNVVGYEILRGSRAGAKSILAKGLFRNMRKYNVPNAENLIGGSVTGLYANYPYNDLRPDMYFWDKIPPAGNPLFEPLKRTEGCENLSQSIQSFPPLGTPNSGTDGYSKKVFTFSSPDLMFTKPFLDAYETRIYGQLDGRQSGNFIPSEDHPQFKLLRNSSALMGAIIGIGYAISQVRGETSEEMTSSKTRYQSTGETVGIAANAAANNIPVISALPIAAGAVFSMQTGTLAAGVLDLWSFGAAQNALDLGVQNSNAAVGLLPATEAGDYKLTIKRNSPISNFPNALKAVVGIFTSGANIAIGGNEIIDLIYNLVKKSSFVLKYNSAGFFNKFRKNNINDTFRFKNTDSNYLGQSFQTFNQGEYKINNLFRPSTVAVALEKDLQDPVVQDRSRFTVGGEVDPSGGFGQATPFGDTYLEKPSSERQTNISAFYGALKFNFDNQYGQLSGIKQVPMRGCVELLDPTKPPQFLYSSKAIFAGDVYINRYTEKVIMPIFAQYLLGQPDEYTYDYSQHVNIPYPRFWLNSQKFDMTKIGKAIGNPINTLTALLGGGFFDDLLPNDLFYLDRGQNSCQNALGAIFNSNDPNPMFAMRFAYMYSHSNGILDFFVESEINLAQRDWEDTRARQIYSVYNYNDREELFHAQIEKVDNFYKYDESLSIGKFPTQLSSFGEVQPLYYDPYVAANCYVSRPKRLIYSLQAQEEARKDFWRVFLPLNYKDFKNKVSVIKPINKNGAIVFFPYLSPQMFPGTDVLKTGLDTKITIGDGGLFAQPMQNIANADLSNEYGSNESLRSAMNTPQGLFFISQAQGKIFQYAGKGLDPISNRGMKWWFNKYLPSQLVKQYPDLEYSVLSDNPVIGVGCHTIYDANDDIVYFMKKDFRVKKEYISSVSYTEKRGFTVRLDTDGGKYSFPIQIGDPLYFDDCCWTISYDPKAKAWISFHDWCPELALPSINHFFTTKSIETDEPQCPPGYTFNGATGLCELIVNETELSTVTVSELNSIVTGGSQDCLLDIVIAMDDSGSTGSTNPGSIGAAQLTWLNSFLTNPAITAPMAAGDMQIGFTKWNSTSTAYQIPYLTGTYSMSNTVTPTQVNNWYTTNWCVNPGCGTNVPLGLASAENWLNNKASSQLGDRTAQPNFKQIIILITDTTSNPGAIGCPYQAVGVSPSSAGPANQNVFALFCGTGSSTPSNPLVLGNITCTSGPVNVDGYQFGIAVSNPAGIDVVADTIATSVCSLPFECNCAPGYTTVYLDPVTGTYTAPTGVCDDITPPICRKVECACPTSPPNFVTTITGTCDDVYLTGDPDYVNPDPQVCDYYLKLTTPASFKYGTLWRHNVRCDDFANFYNISYPWEVELVANSGQQVNTVRSMEYQLECYVYKGDMGNACNDDKWEDLDFNFDQSIIYNNEQVSGLLQLTPTPYNQPLLNLTYPIIGASSIEILCSKVEQKYRFNQFWDITNDRGEFTIAEQPIWKTQPNGYIKNLNAINLNYNKPPLQHKKFRHYYTNIILRRVNSSNRKMLLRLNNSKLLTSLR